MTLQAAPFPLLPIILGGGLPDQQLDVGHIDRDKSIENREGVCARAVHGRYQNVFLSGAELSELQADFPTVWQEYIERLSEYMASTGKQYRNHAATIRRWIADDRRKAAPPARDRDYSVEDGDTV